MITLIMTLYTLKLIHLHGPGNQTIDINPNEIISLRTPYSSEHFAKGIQCIVSTADGKFGTVLEDCATIKAIMEGAR